ncbi:hypothetical protein ACFX2A_004185 [Malus domestica]
MIGTNAIQDSFFTNQLITAFSTLCRLDYAVLAFSHMENLNVFVFNAMIRGFVHSDHPFQALNCYINIMVVPSSYTFSPLIKACTSQ